MRKKEIENFQKGANIKFNVGSGNTEVVEASKDDKPLALRILNNGWFVSIVSGLVFLVVGFKYF